jgi:hypothetical protein
MSRQRSPSLSREIPLTLFLPSRYFLLGIVPGHDTRYPAGGTADYIPRLFRWGGQSFAGRCPESIPTGAAGRRQIGVPFHRTGVNPRVTTMNKE